MRLARLLRWLADRIDPPADDVVYDGDTPVRRNGSWLKLRRGLHVRPLTREDDGGWRRVDDSSEFPIPPAWLKRRPRA